MAKPRCGMQVCKNLAKINGIKTPKIYGFFSKGHFTNIIDK
jgi:hypothetical protein